MILRDIMVSPTAMSDRWDFSNVDSCATKTLKKFDFSVYHRLRLSSDISHMLTFSMQMVYVSRET